jgi:5'-nucleotidase
MRILLSNDDGIYAAGLKVLERIARTLSDDIWIVAPERNQSGAGHSLTLSDPLRVRSLTERKFAINGTPTDCVVFACRHIMKEHRPDLVLSGVNYGDNLAENVTYSGTVAAAMEASLFDIPSVAMSLALKAHSDNVHWEVAEHYGHGIVQKLLRSNIPPHVFVNVNFPNIPLLDVKGYKITRQGKHDITGDLVERMDPRGQSYFWVGALRPPKNVTPETDVGAIDDHYISVTPLSIDMTDQPTYSHLKEVFHS